MTKHSDGQRSGQTADESYMEAASFTGVLARLLAEQWIQESATPQSSGDPDVPEKNYGSPVDKAGYRLYD